MAAAPHFTKNGFESSPEAVEMVGEPVRTDFTVCLALSRLILSSIILEKLAGREHEHALSSGGRKVFGVSRDDTTRIACECCFEKGFVGSIRKPVGQRATSHTQSISLDLIEKYLRAYP
ncbi:MAG: hypothetical protein OJF52_002262 [Nitrospira sp.]|jgi:hypothetical protein|nr:MAG: hypothetical protein OJF52_002262 [Nitrospira sp.]